MTAVRPRCDVIRESAEGYLASLEAFTPAYAPAVWLTPRQHSVLELVAQGYSNAEIGLHLGVSLQTVKNHLAVIYAKYDVTSRTEAVIRAIRDREVAAP